MHLKRTSFAKRLSSYAGAIELAGAPILEGRLLRMVGLTLEAEGLRAAMGSRCMVINDDSYHPVQVEAEVALTAKIGALEQLMTHLFEPIAEQDTQIEKSLVDLVQHITRQVIQRELAIDSTQIEHVMREALKLLPLGVGNVRLYINPQDFEQVKALRERHEETWRIVEDESLLPGGCRVETEHSRIDATVETRIARVMDKLFDQLHEQALHPAAPDLSLELPIEGKPAVAPAPDVPDAP